MSIAEREERREREEGKRCVRTHTHTTREIDSEGGEDKGFVKINEVNVL